MSLPKSAVVAGHICLDIFPSLDHLPPGVFGALFQPGRLIECGPARFATGGPVSNAGLALHRLGVPVRLMARVGCDPFGEIVWSLVKEKDPRLVSGIQREAQAVTSYSVIISPPDQDRIFLHCPGANDSFSAVDLDFDLLSQVDLFHFGYPPIMRQMYVNDGAGLVELLGRARQTGVTVSLDMAFPDPSSESGRADWRMILEKALPHVDIFLPSLEELLFILRRKEYDRLNRDEQLLQNLSAELLSSLSEEVIEMGAKIVVLKLGHRGLYLRSTTPSGWRQVGRALPPGQGLWNSRELWSPCFQVNVVGTTGSGDASIAGFLAAVLRELSPERALVMGTAVGACNVEQADALSGLHSWEDTRSRIAAGWSRSAMDIPGPGWTWDPEHSLWVGPADAAG
ncbi:MAG: carbohydrate kinase family protein [Anaerolineales bacterium]|nr:carbohydrate kinase family protein [Anaerolineales bacterium]